MIERYSAYGDTVLDPFMGSGTANVEVLILGKNSVGIDVDPFSKMLSRVKTTILPSREVASVWKEDFFRICFSSITRQTSEADNNCTRTVARKSLQKKVVLGMGIQLFIKKNRTRHLWYA